MESCAGSQKALLADEVKTAVLVPPNGEVEGGTNQGNQRHGSSFQPNRDSIMPRR
jgi:hypothetical protein